MRDTRRSSYRLFWSCLFAISFAFVEAAVVIYLRALYYPRDLCSPCRFFYRSHPRGAYQRTLDP